MVRINILYEKINKQISLNVDGDVVVNEIKKMFLNNILFEFKLLGLQYEIFESRNNQNINLKHINKKINEYYENLDELYFHIIKHDQDIVNEFLLRFDDDICMMCCSIFTRNSGVDIICNSCETSIYHDYPDYDVNSTNIGNLLSN